MQYVTCHYQPERVAFAFTITHLVFAEVKFTSSASQQG